MMEWRWNQYQIMRLDRVFIRNDHGQIAVEWKKYEGTIWVADSRSYLKAC